LKVVWDMGNGAAGPLVSALTKHLPGEHSLLNADVDGSFPAHHPDPLVAANLAQLIDEVRLQGADFGIAFDGDGDRIGVVDESGEIRWGDQHKMLYAEEVLASAPGSAIIADVKASQQFFDHVHRLGGIAHLSPSGHSIIKRTMKDMKCLLAGEMSGHIFFADRNFGYDDAIYAAVRLIGICSTLNQSLSAWFNAFSKTYATPEMRLNTEHADKFQIVSAVKAELRSRHKSFNDIDGIRMTSPDGWWLLRASNTQEELVTRIEGNTESGLRTLHNELESFLKPHGLSIGEGHNAA
ncbi:MAG: phosphomannomutase/phosphoglucomutase, partial [Alphaproteobacteria bacterium]|nr:phosphomannomutase/phosphoglucomutase [Alphaproteobacteria bacterium]